MNVDVIKSDKVNNNWFWIMKFWKNLQNNAVSKCINKPIVAYMPFIYDKGDDVRPLGILFVKISTHLEDSVTFVCGWWSLKSIDLCKNY